VPSASPVVLVAVSCLWRLLRVLLSLPSSFSTASQPSLISSQKEEEEEEGHDDDDDDDDDDDVEEKDFWDGFKNDGGKKSLVGRRGREGRVIWPHRNENLTLVEPH